MGRPAGVLVLVVGVGGGVVLVVGVELVVGVPAAAGWLVVLMCPSPVESSGCLGEAQPAGPTVGDSMHSRQVLEIPDSLRRCEPDQV
jgi:hypothetical protein